MDNYIFSPNVDTIDKNYKSAQDMYYTLYGDHEYIDEEGNPRTNDDKNNKILARNSNGKFYIKIGAHGRIFNPIGMYSEGRHQKFLSKIGKNEFDFAKVNQKVFDLYLNFLRTKNTAWLSNAERELI